MKFPAVLGPASDRHRSRKSGPARQSEADTRPKPDTSRLPRARSRAGRERERKPDCPAAGTANAPA